LLLIKGSVSLVAKRKLKGLHAPFADVFSIPCRPKILGLAARIVKYNALAVGALLQCRIMRLPAIKVGKQLSCLVV
jgi:hypothetical protein